MAPRWLRNVLYQARRLDFVLLLLCGTLLVVGCLFIYGIGRQMGGSFEGYWRRQLVWIVLGGGCFAVTAFTDYRRLGERCWYAYGAGIGLLVLVLLFGKTINSAKSWLSLGAFTLQPAELMKPAAALALAFVVSRPGRRVDRGERLVPVALLLGLPVVLIVMQPDFGTALVFLPAGALVLFLAGFRYKWILIALLVVVLSAPVGYEYGLGPRQRERIVTFLQLEDDVSDTGWNIHQSLIAVGSGGLWGKGYMHGTQYVLGFLPRNVAMTDFIFAVIAEETGFVGAAAVVCALAGVILCCLHTASVAADALGAYIAVGIASMLIVHIYINVGMTIQAAPIIGIPLPLVSYGGSFMLGTMISLGLVQSVHIRRP